MGYLYITRGLRCLVLVNFIQWLSSISSRPRSALQRSSADKFVFTSGSWGSTYTVKCSIPVSLEFFEPVRTSGLPLLYFLVSQFWGLVKHDCFLNMVKIRSITEKHLANCLLAYHVLATVQPSFFLVMINKTMLLSWQFWKQWLNLSCFLY